MTDPETTSPAQSSNAQKVRAFHAAISAPYPERPQVPDLTTLELRLTLIREETQEVEAEFGRLAEKLGSTAEITAADLAPLAHELADLLYVAYGALGSLGVDADAVFAEVHRANLSKASGPRRADGKQLKPEGWQKADVLGVLLKNGPTQP